ncbi:hypothetical protein COCSADRAFT_38441 [Bipolaris sorokiniana ND90Pr]|uniref:Uncharacterized protein n=1 Tax=Cochliobolus sativus (strain ND90Pr / ATCC 201652) TaxID=665912 RepID=M2T015_COCSN|nr:uncharacterized protein COCSADRAFT_38441 [Bipolaris sorokiniana ND90Pr]EMD62526.1 hypothetical protein COCSADRAFT_38441 [Bipolaris sorokiniana ND90Pr]
MSIFPLQTLPPKTHHPIHPIHPIQLSSAQFSPAQPSPAQPSLALHTATTHLPLPPKPYTIQTTHTYVHCPPPKSLSHVPSPPPI